ncbi:MAG: hypothetical protein K6B65_05900 [Bacilli bacterium]|nr:hypothetical protein [Bacilli bacterium]
MSANVKKTNSKLWIGAIAALVVGIVVAMILVPAETSVGSEKWGWVAGTFWYWGSFTFTYTSAQLAALFGMTFFYMNIVCAIVACVLAIVKKSKKLFVNAVIFLAIAFFLSYNVLVAMLGAELGALSGTAGIGAVLSVALIFSAMLINLLDLKPAAPAEVREEKAASKEEGLSEEEVREIVRQEIGEKEEPKQERTAEGLTKEDKEEIEQLIADKTLDEDEVREIVRDELSNYEVVGEEEEQPAEEEPKQEEPVQEEPAQEEPAEEEPEEEGENEEGEEEGEEEGDEEAAEEGEPVEIGVDGKFPSSRRRTASFETKLKGSDYDLRHKYYDLRDYIKSYGVNNRISRPGDTFSLHREKLVFMTISGKHLKVCYALNPEDYANSTIPVATNTSKKFIDLPLAFKVKSDLSFRRAKKLVDDLMAAKGYTKEEK